MKIKFNLIFLILLFLLFNYPITKYGFVYDNRIYFVTPLILLMAVRFLTSLTLKNKSISLDSPSKILIFAFSILTLLDLWKNNYVPAAGSLIFVLMILVFNTYNYEKLFKQIIKLNQVINFLVLFSLGTFFFFYDTWPTFTVYGFSVPHFTSFAEQASLVPVIFLLPLSVFLLFSTEHRIFHFIYFTLAICLGGSTYLALIVAFGLFFIIDRIPKILFIALPFILMIAYSSLVYYFITDFVPIDFSVYEKGKEYNSLDYFREQRVTEDDAMTSDWGGKRAMSGVERFILLRDQIIVFKNNIIWGIEKEFGTFGSLIMEFGVRGGILFLFLMSLFFTFLLKDLYKYNKYFPNKKIGVVLIYSLLIQAFVYNANAFSILFSIALFFLTSKLLRAKNKEIQVKMASKKSCVANLGTRGSPAITTCLQF